MSVKNIGGDATLASGKCDTDFEEAANVWLGNVLKTLSSTQQIRASHHSFKQKRAERKPTREQF